MNEYIQGTKFCFNRHYLTYTYWTTLPKQASILLYPLTFYQIIYVLPKSFSVRLVGTLCISSNLNFTFGFVLKERFLIQDLLVGFRWSMVNLESMQNFVLSLFS